MSLSAPVSRRRSVYALFALAVVAILGAKAAEAQLNPYSRGGVIYGATNDLRGDYTAAGVALRGSGGSGVITINGIPTPGSYIKEAILYWSILAGASMPVGADMLSFAAHPITGALIGQTASPCQGGFAGAYVFRADVTPWVTGNGGYPVTGVLDSGNAGVSPVAEGASLVIIYSNITAANRDILVYDGASLVTPTNSTVTTNLAFFDATSPITGSSIAFIVGNGTAALPDSAVVNGLTVGMNSFDGGDPPIGTQYWDTDAFITTLIVSSGATSVPAQVTVPTSGGDCLIWVASPFSVTSPIPLVDVVTESLTPTVPRNTNFQMRVSVFNNSGAQQHVDAQIDVYTQGGRFLGTMVARSGRLQANSFTQANFHRKIPAFVPAAFLNVPLYVYTFLVDHSTHAFIDDDYVIMYVQ